MDFIIKSSFSKQLDLLQKKYKLVFKDFENFKNNFNLNDGKHLGKGIYKFRMKNSSILTGKSGGFRIILFVRISEDKVLPFIIYSKNRIENITFNDILKELKKCI